PQITQILLINLCNLWISAQRVVLHERHSERRRALRVPHAVQRTYIVRANQLVINALPPRMTIKTAALSRKSFKP
ncbi:MAG TPA: hypothetical protein VGD41_18050, partial [Pyrinomonadaceae bacterium]